MYLVYNVLSKERREGYLLTFMFIQIEREWSEPEMEDEYAFLRDPIETRLPVRRHSA